MVRLVRVGSVLLAALCSTAASGAEPVLEVLVLGSGGPRPSAQASAGTLVLLDGVPRLLVDAGQGTLLRAGEQKADLSALDAVLLTHLHVDHSVEVPAFVIARSLDSSAKVHLRVFGPPGNALFPSTVQWSERLFGPAGLYRYVRQFGAETRVVATNVAPPPGKTSRLPDLDGAVLTGRTLHHGDAPSVGYRIERAGRSVVFAGDIDRSGLPSLEALARGADLLVVSCAVLDPPDSSEALYDRHTGPRLLAETAARAGVGRLLFTHVPPAVLSRRSEVERSVQGAFKGELLIAADGLRAVVEAAPAVLSTNGEGGCQSNADCGRGRVCVSCGKESSCVAGCSTSTDCSPGQICSQVQCIRCPCPAQCRAP